LKRSHISVAKRTYKPLGCVCGTVTEGGVACVIIFRLSGAEGLINGVK
jgi:hypothetical protein